MDQNLKQIYEDPTDSGSYGGVDRLLASARAKGLDVDREKVTEFLKSYRPYTLHKPVRKHFSRNPTIVGGIDAQWQADIVDMQSLSRKNNGYKYIVTVIDCFSKYAWAVPLKTKTGGEMVDAFSQIFKAGRRPVKLHTDKGKEFLNLQFQKFLVEHDVHHFYTENETKAAMVERFNRTLKSRMWTYFTAKGTEHYLDVLQSLLDSYNHSVHRTIGMRPAQVRKSDEKRLFAKMYSIPLASAGKERDTGPYVRISKAKGVFEKGYRPNWVGEVFKVRSKVKQPRKTQYVLEDIGATPEALRGRFYPEEVQTVHYDPNAPQPIERIVKSRMRKGIKEHFVKWLDYPANYNSWVSDTELHRV